MANFLFDSGREFFLSQNPALDWDTQDITIQLHDDDDVAPLQATHDYEDDLAAGSVAQSGFLQTKTVTDGVADADDITLSTVSGDEFESIIVFSDSGTPASSPLIARIDTATGLPCTPNGGDITVQWDSGANRIFKL